MQANSERGVEKSGPLSEVVRARRIKLCPVSHWFSDSSLSHTAIILLQVDHREQDQLSHPFSASSPICHFLSIFYLLIHSDEIGTLQHPQYAIFQMLFQSTGQSFYFMDACQQLHKQLTNNFTCFF